MILLIYNSLIFAKDRKMFENEDSTAIIFDFIDKSEVDIWKAVNDGVMGGLSDGSASYSDQGFLVFSGTISLENNGGFSSIRTLPDVYDLSKYNRIVIRVLGDGRTYQFRLRIDRAFEGLAYKHDFNTISGEWTEIELPFDSFVPTIRGRIIEDADSLNPGEIKQLGFLISDKKAGPFKLIVDNIKACK